MTCPSQNHRTREKRDRRADKLSKWAEGVRVLLSPAPSKLLGIWLLLLCGGCQTTPPQVAASTVASRANTQPTTSVQASQVCPVVEIPFRLADDHIYVPVRVNQSEPLSFVLDTGASTSVVGLARTEELRLKQGFWKWKAGGWSGWVPARFLSGVSFDLAGHKYSPSLLISLPLPDDWWNPLDGVLGYDLFKRYVVEIDFPARKIRLYARKGYHYTGSGTALPMKLRRGYPLVEATVTGANGQLIRGQFEIDSGSGDVVALAEPLVRTNKLTETGGRVFRTVSWNIAGQFPTLYGHVPKFQWGPYTFEQPTARFMLHPMVADKGQAGIIGTGLLERFKVIFDYSRRRVILEPNADFGKPFPIRWHGEVLALSSEGFRLRISGAELIARAPDFMQFRVNKIRRGSPADQAGLRVGDVLSTIDGQPASAVNLGQWMNLVDQEGQTCLVELQRGQEKLTVQLKLEWLCFWDRS
jgi:hypothetical protein